MSGQAVKLASELTFSTVQQESQRFLKLVRDSKITALCLDLSEVHECDSAGLALLIEAKRLCKQYNKVLTIEKMPKMISTLATFCGVEGILCTAPIQEKVPVKGKKTYLFGKLEDVK